MYTFFFVLLHLSHHFWLRYGFFFLWFLSFYLLWFQTTQKELKWIERKKNLYSFPSLLLLLLLAPTCSVFECISCMTTIFRMCVCVCLWDGCYAMCPKLNMFVCFFYFVYFSYNIKLLFMCDISCILHIQRRRRRKKLLLKAWVIFGFSFFDLFVMMEFFFSVILCCLFFSPLVVFTSCGEFL